jgi:hypothetical protein
VVPRGIEEGEAAEILRDARPLGSRLAEIIEYPRAKPDRAGGGPGVTGN